MKTKDLMEFLRQFDPDSEVNFLVAMLSQKALFGLDEVNAGAVHKERRSGCSVVYVRCNGSGEDA